MRNTAVIVYLSRGIIEQTVAIDQREGVPGGLSQWGVDKEALTATHTQRAVARHCRFDSVCVI